MHIRLTAPVPFDADSIQQAKRNIRGSYGGDDSMICGNPHQRLMQHRYELASIRRERATRPQLAMFYRKQAAIYLQAIPVLRQLAALDTAQIRLWKEAQA